MDRQRIGSFLAGFAAVAFIGTALLHATGYDSVTELAKQGPADLQQLMQALWLVFSLGLVVLGVIVGAVAFRPIGAGRAILVVAALFPLGAAGLQIRYLGFIAPTAILFGVGVLTLAAASVISRKGM